MNDTAPAKLATNKQLSGFLLNSQTAAAMYASTRKYNAMVDNKYFLKNMKLK